MKISMRSTCSALLTLFCLEARSADGPSQPGGPSATPDSVVISNILCDRVLQAREEQARNLRLILSNFMASRGLKGPEWSIIGQRASALDRSLAKDTNVISGPITNGCRLFLRLGTNAVPLGDPITVYVVIQNDSDQAIFYNTSSLEIPWFCEFTVLDERGKEPPPTVVERPYFGSNKGVDLVPGRQDEYEIRLDRIYSIKVEGRYSIYAKKVFQRVASGAISKITAGPAILHLVQK